MPINIDPTLLFEIKDVFEIIKKIKGKKQVALWDLAKELGANKVPLYRMMIDNPKLFVLDNFIKVKEKRNRNSSLVENLTGDKYSVETSKEDMGVYVYEVYLRPDDNPRTPEYISSKKERMKSYIEITPFKGPRTGRVSERINAMMIQIDKPDDDTEAKESSWRNTPEKVAVIAHAYSLKPAIFTQGNQTFDFENCYQINRSQLEKISEDGWQTNYDKDEDSTITSEE